MLRLSQSSLFSKLLREELCAERISSKVLPRSAFYSPGTDGFSAFHLLLSSSPCSEPFIGSTMLPSVRLSGHMQRYIRKPHSTRFVLVSHSSSVDLDDAVLVYTYSMIITRTWKTEFGEVVTLKHRLGHLSNIHRSLAMSLTIFVVLFWLLFGFLLPFFALRPLLFPLTFDRTSGCFANTASGLTYPRSLQTICFRVISSSCGGSSLKISVLIIQSTCWKLQVSVKPDC